MISGQLAEISSVTFDGSFAWIGPEIKENVVQMNMMGKICKFVRPHVWAFGEKKKREKKKEKNCACLLLSVLKKNSFRWNWVLSKDG